MDVDYNLPLSDIAPLLLQQVNEPPADQLPLTPEEENWMDTEVNIAAEADSFGMGILDMGELTPLTCPECNGALVSIREGKLVRYRCHTGHAFTASSLLAETTKVVEESYWKAVRSLEETVILLESSAKQFAEGGNVEAAEQFFEKARETREKARKTRRFAMDQEKYSQDSTV